MKSLFHYYALGIGVIFSGVLFTGWWATLVGPGPEKWPHILTMALITVGLVIFSFGALQHMRGKIDL
jgi:hypothetical protein